MFADSRGGGVLLFCGLVSRISLTQALLISCVQVRSSDESYSPYRGRDLGGRQQKEAVSSPPEESGATASVRVDPNAFPF